MADNICRMCGTPLDENVKFCMRCGAKVLEKPQTVGLVCSACGAALEPGMKFCVMCAHPVEQQSEAANEVEPEKQNVIPEAQEDTLAEPEEQAEMPEEPVEEEQVYGADEPYSESEFTNETKTYTEPTPEMNYESSPKYEQGAAWQQPGGAQQTTPPFVPMQPGAQQSKSQYIPPQMPDKKSKYANIGTAGWVGIFFLMMIPLVNLVLLIIWACGGCRKEAKTKFARAALIMILISIVILVAFILIVRFAILPEISRQLRVSEGIRLENIEDIIELFDEYGFERAIEMIADAISGIA